MRFFSRSAIYIWDRRTPSTPYLAIEPVELMQEGEGGSLEKKTIPPSPLQSNPPFFFLQPKHQHTDHLDTVNQLCSVLPMHQFNPVWALCPLISSLLSFSSSYSFLHIIIIIIIIIITIIIIIIIIIHKQQCKVVS